MWLTVWVEVCYILPSCQNYLRACAQNKQCAYNSDKHGTQKALNATVNCLPSLYKEILEQRQWHQVCPLVMYMSSFSQPGLWPSMLHISRMKIVQALKRSAGQISHRHSTYWLWSNVLWLQAFRDRLDLRHMFLRLGYSLCMLPVHNGMSVQIWPCYPIPLHDPLWTIWCLRHLTSLQLEHCVRQHATVCCCVTI